MSLKYALYQGCAAKGATPELYQSTMAIIGRLGIEVTELTASSCCGAGVVAEADPDGALALNARTFAQAEQLGLDVMTICGTCQGVMSTANRQLKADPALLQRVNRLLEPEGLAYQGRVQVKHLLWIVFRDVGLHEFKEAKEGGADAMVTPCPLCHMSLDIYQERAARKVETNLNLPILHLPQMLGLAMGVPSWELGVERHLVPVDRIVKVVEERKSKVTHSPLFPGGRGKGEGAS